MSSWLENGRSSILDVLTDACDEIDKQARAEIADRDRKNAQLLEELAALKSRAGEVDRLRQQNESLRAEISRLRGEKINAQHASLESRTALGELSRNKLTNDRRSATLQTQSASGRSNSAEAYTKLAAEYEKARIKVRQRNKVIDQWASYADLLEKKLRSLQTKLKRSQVATDEQKGICAALARNGEESDAPDTKMSVADINLECERPFSPPLIVSLGKPFVSLSPTSILPEPLPPQAVILEKSGSPENTKNGTRAQNIDLPLSSTSATSYHDIAVKSEPSSDEPVVVSAKPVRKRKHGDEDTENERLQRIKYQHSSSSSIEVAGETPHFSAAESIDFEEEAHVPTPRKRRFLPREDQGKAVGESESAIKSRVADVARHEILGGAITSDKHCTPSHGAISLGSPSHLSSALHDSLHYLQRSFPPMNSSSRARRDPYVSSLTLGVMNLGEDGENVSGDMQRPAAKGRLDILLNSPSKTALTPINRNRIAPQDVETPRAVSFHHHQEGVSGLPTPLEVTSGGVQTLRQELAMPKTDAKPGASHSPRPSVARERGSKRPSILREDMPRGRSTTREDTPLRGRPIERLRPEDFKPNPRYNDGFTYVYDEVVRGKDARATLSGCTDLNCCGKTFKHFAEAELKDVGPSIMTRGDDINLMEKYLGDEAWQLGTVTREEKEKIWILAKTWELANKFGKHRQRYSRMPTPPGFWSVDFPNTQERAEELRQAEEIRKALVQERYREAMRCGGSWLFRDEDPR